MYNYMRQTRMEALDTYVYGDDLAMLTDGHGGVLFYAPEAACDLGEWA